MYIILALVWAAAYAVSTYMTYNALLAPVLSKRATFGITGMIASGFLLGSVLEHLLP